MDITLIKTLAEYSEADVYTLTCALRGPDRVVSNLKWVLTARLRYHLGLRMAAWNQPAIRRTALTHSDVRCAIVELRVWLAADYTGLRHYLSHVQRATNLLFHTRKESSFYWLVRHIVEEADTKELSIDRILEYDGRDYLHQ